jgi:hypothetical protein
MAKITWLGSEDYREGESPLESCTWNGVLFTAGDKVEVTDEWMIAKAKGNRFFLVEEAGGNTPPAISPAAPFGPAKPEMWTNEPQPDVSFFDDPPERYPDTPPDYPPEDEPDRPVKRRGRPPRIRENGE